MIAAHLETMYPHHAIELVVIRAEEAYDPALVERLRAYGQEPDAAAAAASRVAHAVSVNLTQPGAHRSVVYTSIHALTPPAELPISSTASTAASPLESLTSLLTTLPSASHPHILANILTSLLHLVASHLPGIAHLLLGETSTRQAQMIIAGTAIGNGWGLPIELQGAHAVPKAGRPARTRGDDASPVTRRTTTPVPFPDTDHVTRIKPLREAMYKEAAYYCHIKRIPTVNHRLWDRTAGTAGVAQAGDKTRIKGVAEARGKGGINSLEKLTEGASARCRPLVRA